ncbi:MAG: hypothetical protein Q8Q30_02865 [Candidatus Woesebacteria bacterium]|nr:hypothetical protein [Candidatus Woesebacteria bacterium]
MSVIPIMVPVQQYPFYVKKREIDDYLAKRRKGAKIGYCIGIGGMIIAQLIISFFVLPKLMSLSNEIGIQSTSYSPPILFASIVIGIILLVALLSVDSLDGEKIKKLKQQEDEMVTIDSKLTKNITDIAYGSYFLISFLAILFSVILPVSALTSGIK